MYRAGYYFCMYFESPDSVRVRSDARGTYAKVTYYPSDLDKYLEDDDDTDDDFELEGQIDQVLSAEEALNAVLNEDTMVTADDVDDLEIRDVVLEVEETESESGKKDAVLPAEKDNTVSGSSNASGSSKVNTVTGTPSAAVNTSSVSITADAGETVNVVWIQSDAYKPGYQPAAAGTVGAGPEAQAK